MNPRKIMENYFRPRTRHLHDVLMGRKSGKFDEKKGTKHQSRAKAKEEFREMLSETESD